MIFNREIKDKFSTFFNIEEKPNKLEITSLQKDRKLAKNIDSLSQSYPEADEDFFAKIFVKEVQKNPQTKPEKEHLSAYLEEACLYLATQELSQQLKPIKWHELDCFQEARKVAAEPSKIFSTYNFTNTAVRTWAKIQIKNKVRQTAYLDREICTYTTWALPKYLSEKILREALKVKSEIKAKKEIESLVLAFKSYKEIYNSNQPEKVAGKLAEPNKKQWEEIKNYYNRQCSRYNNKLSSDGSDTLELITNFQQIRDKIITCVKVARDYCCIREDVDTNATEKIADSKAETIPLNCQEAEIEDAEQQQIKSVCLSEFFKLTPECQKLMQLSYGLNISQREMNEIFDLDLDQYQICRKIQGCEKKLLKALMKWCEENLEITTNDGNLKGRNQLLKEWLRYYFQQQFYGVLQENLLERQKEKIMVLRLYYGQRLNLDAVAEKLNVSRQTVVGEIEMVQQNLEIFLQQWVKEKMDICLSKSINNKKIKNFVEQWLKIAPYAMW